MKINNFYINIKHLNFKLTYCEKTQVIMHFTFKTLSSTVFSQGCLS